MSNNDVESRLKMLANSSPVIETGATIYRDALAEIRELKEQLEWKQAALDNANDLLKSQAINGSKRA